MTRTRTTTAARPRRRDGPVTARCVFCIGDGDVAGVGGGGAAASGVSAAAAAPRLCQRCHVRFLPSENGPVACVYHPESYSGEDSQRWTAPGERPPEGVSTTSYFWSCCGSADPKARGCVAAPHVGYGDEDDGWGRRPDDARPPSP